MVRAIGCWMFDVGRSQLISLAFSLQPSAFPQWSRSPVVCSPWSVPWPWWSLVGALWTHEGRMRVALMSHEGGFGVATAWLATRIEVALMSH